MPRKARIEAPGALHHVIIRGIERRTIFRFDYDRARFVKRLAELIPETSAGRTRETHKRYRRFVEIGVSLGKRPDFVGGGFLRSLGGWRGLRDFWKAGIRLK